MRPGDRCDKCYFILSGCIKQYQIIDGEEKITAFFTENQPAVMYQSYLEESPSPYFLTCMEPCTLSVGSRADERRLHQKFPRLENMAFQLMYRDFNKTRDDLNLLNHYGPEQRYLLLLENQPQLFQRIPLKQIASYLGITPESLSRIRNRVAQKSQS